MIILDARVLIAHLESTDRQHARATQLLLDAADEELAASPLTLAEVLVGPARAGQLAQAHSLLRELDLTSIPLGDDAAVRLAILHADTRLRLPDCGVLLAAGTVHGAVATFDTRLAVAAAELGHQVHSGAVPTRVMVVG